MSIIVPSLDKKKNHKKMDLSSFISSYHLFLSSFMKGLLFVMILMNNDDQIIEGSRKASLIKEKQPVYGSISQIFLQRTNSISNTQLFPQPSYEDYLSIFGREEYDPYTLVMNGLKSLEKAQMIVASMKKENGVSEIVWKDCCTMCQRVGIIDGIECIGYVNECFGGKKD